nr:MAG: hypothetical protein [Bacteriophage sp.]
MKGITNGMKKIKNKFVEAMTLEKEKNS